MVDNNNNELIIRGQVYLFGDNVNTDDIIPSKYLDIPDPQYWAKFVMSGIDRDFANLANQAKDNVPIIITAGVNFGSGSSREMAVDALKYSGVKAIIAKSFGSIFFRNAINVGLPLVILDDISPLRQNSIITIHVEKGKIIIEDNKQQLNFKPLESFLLTRLKLGGLIPELTQEVERMKH